MIIAISGVSSGIGGYLAEKLVEDGHQIVGFSRNIVEKFDKSMIFFHGDVRMANSWKTAWQYSIRYFNTVPDVLINNAGILYTSKIGESNLDSGKAVLDTNLMGAILGIETFVNHWKSTNTLPGKRIINVSSFAGHEPFKEYLFYSAAKAGLSMVTKQTAKELAPNVFVGEIAPGMIAETQMTDTEQAFANKVPMKRYGMLSEVYDACKWLLVAPMYATGCSIKLSGGQ